MEIELKFLIAAQDLESIQQLMGQLPFETNVLATKQLQNAYYDTEDKVLRQHDIGVRTRRSVEPNGRSSNEQTVKLAGQDIGGLHQRPEHTEALELDVEFADLNLFNADIWPQGLVISEVQSKLQKMFFTDFQRQVWHVDMPGGTQIECVLDQGAVISGEQKQAISELELEIVHGEVAELFQLAGILATSVPMKLGFLSKAARGYQLAAGQKLKSINLEVANLTENITVEAAFEALLSKAVKYIQHNESVFSEHKTPKPLRRVIDGLSFLIHLLSLFNQILKVEKIEQLSKGFKAIKKQLAWVDGFYQIQQLQNRQSPYRKDIEKNQVLATLLAGAEPQQEKLEQALNLFASKEVNRLMLSLMSFMQGKHWRGQMPLERLPVLSLPLTTYSNEWLQQAWVTLQGQLLEHQTLSSNSFLEKVYWPLAKELLTGVCVGSLYQEQEWLAFRNPLLDLLVGCEEFLLLATLEQLVVDSELDEEELNDIVPWINGKQQSLLMALNASVKNSLKLKPYW